MAFRRFLLPVFLALTATYAATFGTIVPLTGGASDIVLDEPRNRLYLVNTARNRIEVYSIPQRRFLNPVTTEELPLAVAISRSGKFLYVTVHTAAGLLVIDLDTFNVVNRISLPARPEGVAVGFDERVLISTVGTGAGNAQNVLVIYDPNAGEASRSLSTVPVAPPAPLDPNLPAPAGRPFLASRGLLRASEDGRLIVGVNIPNAQARVVFVYEAVSGTVLRSRAVAGISGVLSIAPDATRFMAGLTMFNMETLAVEAQQNAANAPYPFPAGTNFNVQQNQGGSVFSPDGSVLYSAFNFAPVQTPAAPPATSQLMLDDPENLLIRTALLLPENLTGKIVVTSDGATAYALSDSGFLILPFATMGGSALASVDSTAILLANDQCGVTADQRSIGVVVRNEGRGRLTAQAQLLQMTPAGAGGLGGAGGPGGGAPGAPVIIIVPPGPGGGGGQPQPLPQPPQLPGGQQTPQNQNIAATAPQVRTSLIPEGALLQFTFNPVVSRAIGTASPTHQFLVTSNEAINIPATVRVFQNQRNTESRGDIMPVAVSLTAAEGLVDLVQDAARQRLYIANSGKNRVEVFDTRQKRFLTPIRASQLPRSLAMTPDGNTLYVASSASETIQIVDLETMEVVGRVKFPPTPFNANVALIAPSVIAATQRGLLMVMNNGTIWKVVDNEALPRRLPPAIFGTATTVPAPRTLAAAPNGEMALLVAGNGFAYLYDAVADEFIQGRQVVTAPITGYFGPVAVGPRGQYFLVNGMVLNQALSAVGNAGTRPIAAVAAVSATSFARFSHTLLANANQLPTVPPNIELADANTGNTLRSSPALEAALSTVTGNARGNVDGRTMAVDPSGNLAYVLTVSGLSLVPLDLPPAADRPAVNANGTVNVANYQASVAVGGLVSLFGRNLGDAAQASQTPLPGVLGGTCVTLNDRPIPLLLTSPGQINAQIPPNLAPGRFTLLVRSTDRRIASQPQQLTVARYAPAVFVDGASNQAAILHADGRFVTPSDPARRDRPLILYATGLGPTKGGQVSEGVPAPANPLAVTENIQVYFGDPRIRESEVIVDWSGLVPGYIGLYQLNLRVPGAHVRGDQLPVTLRIGGVNSPVAGQFTPVVAVD